MKKTRSKRTTPILREMRPEYRFDYQQARPNRFASRMSRGSVAVVLEPDVASVFKTSDAVNGLLRSVIAALPDRRRSDSPRSRRKKAG